MELVFQDLLILMAAGWVYPNEAVDVPAQRGMVGLSGVML